MLIDIPASYTNVKMNGISTYIYEKSENKYVAFKGVEKRNSGFSDKDDCCKDYIIIIYYHINYV